MGGGIELGRQPSDVLAVPTGAIQNAEQGDSTMKKVTSALLTAAIGIFLCSCGQPNAAEAPNDAANTVTTGSRTPESPQELERVAGASLPVGVEGTWIYSDMRGLTSATDGAARLIEFTDDGAFRWFTESSNGITAPTERKGTYSVSNGTVTLDYEGKEQTETRQFLNKGRTLLLRAGPTSFKNYNEPYWEYFYRQTDATKATRMSKTDGVLQQVRDHVTITGTLTTRVKDYYISRGYQMGSESGTYAQWTADLILTNTLPFDIDLGNTFIVAQHPEEGLATGFVRIRGVNPRRKEHKTPPRPHASYLLDDFDSTGGGSTAVVGGGQFVFDDKGNHSVHAGFGRILACTPYVFFEEMNPHTWLKPEAVAGISIILPEFMVHTPHGTEGYQVILSMQKDSDTEDGFVWSVQRLDVVPMKLDVLREILTSTDSTIFKKILAVNWMALADADNASPELAKLMGAKTEGNVLAACLTCYEQYGLFGFEARAAELEYDSNAAVGIQLRATTYLDQMDYRRPGVVSISAISNALPQASSAGAQQRDPPTLGTERLLAVRFAPANKMVVRRVVVDLGRSRNPKLMIYSDNQGLPGVKVADFAGAGDDFRGEHRMDANEVCWIAASSETIPGWADPFWSMCPRNSTFGPYAVSNDGGKTWSLDGSDIALKATVYALP